MASEDNKQLIVSLKDKDVFTVTDFSKHLNDVKLHVV